MEATFIGKHLELVLSDVELEIVEHTFVDLRAVEFEEMVHVMNNLAFKNHLLKCSLLVEDFDVNSFMYVAAHLILDTSDYRFQVEILECLGN